MQWTSVSDQEFGGSSSANIAFDATNKNLSLEGIIDTEDRDKIITMPFIGLLQKEQFNFKVGFFNCLAVTIKSDGYPI